MGGMKGVVIEVDMYKNIRQSFINGESQRDIANRLGIARQTVKKYCEGDSHPKLHSIYYMQLYGFATYILLRRC